MSDPFFAVDTRRDGTAALRHRQTADHEACHAATAIALGWRVNYVEAPHETPGHGETDCEPPAERSDARCREENLLIAMAPAALGGAASGGDRTQAWKLAGELVGEGRPLVDGAGRGHGPRDN